MKKNDELVLEITDMTDEGLGVGKADGFTYFVKDSIAGDTVLCGVTKLKKSYGYARLIRIIKSSPDRIEPPCPVARQCGGCQLQQLDYGAQLRLKENKVKNALIRIGGFPEEQIESLMEPIMPSVKQLRYRNKAQFPIGRGKDGGLRAGFYAGRTHSIIAQEDCILGAEENRIVLSAILSWMESHDIAPYDELSHKGLIRHVLIRKSRAFSELMVCIVINGRELPNKEELIKTLLDALDKEGSSMLGSLSISSNMKATNVIMGDSFSTIYGTPYIEDEIRLFDEQDSDKSLDIKAEALSEGAVQSVRFRISPLSFYQVNPLQMERLYQKALSYAELRGTETVWDLYCGIGTISLFLAQKAGKVYGVEVVPEAIENAKENAKLNGLGNTEFFVGRAEDVLPSWYEEHKGTGSRGATPDVIVVDPPRKGCDEACLETMVRMQPKRIVYVSCDPATLARDLKYLCQNGYELKRIAPCDMFPQTVHCECAVKLERKILKSKK